jgi:hypothetical protein
VADSLRDPLLGKKAKFLATMPLIVTREDQRRLRGRRARNIEVVAVAPGGRGGGASVLEAEEGREEGGKRGGGRRLIIEAQLRGPSTIDDNDERWANLFLNVYGGERCR